MSTMIPALASSRGTRDAPVQPAKCFSPVRRSSSSHELDDLDAVALGDGDAIVLLLVGDAEVVLDHDGFGLELVTRQQAGEGERFLEHRRGAIQRDVHTRILSAVTAFRENKASPSAMTRNGRQREK